MKKTLLKILTAVAAVLMPWPLAAVNNIIHTAYYNGNVTIGTDTLGGVTYATVHYDGLYNGGAPGTPSLPVDYIRFSVPYNATNFTVTALPKNIYSSCLDYPIYPCQEPRMISDTTPVVITLPDSAVYFSGNDYPAQRAWVVDEGFLAGENHIVTVAVMPITYSYTAYGLNRHTFNKSKSVKLTLNYDLNDSLAMYPIVREDSVLREEGYAQTRSMVVNPGQVKSFAPLDLQIEYEALAVSFNNETGSALNGNGHIAELDSPLPDNLLQQNTTGIGIGELHMKAKYLIVTTADLIQSMRRLAALKRQEGYSVGIVTMDQVMNDPIARLGDRVNDIIAYNDSAGSLRQYLRYCYSKCGTEYVLLAGHGVPYRLKSFNKTEAPSDLYFCDLNADWNYDSIDKCQELYVGRLLADNPEQISNYTDKLLRYELNPGRGDYSYLKSALFTEGHDMHKTNEVQNLKIHSDSIFTYSCVMVEDTTSGVRYPTGTDVVNEINGNRYGYLSFHNHGSPAAIITYGLRHDDQCPSDAIQYRLWAIDTVRFLPNAIDPSQPASDGLNCLTNKYYPSICYSIACTTMPYDRIPEYSSVSMNVGKSFTVGADYGGVAFLGNTRKGRLKSSSRLEELFVQQLINGNCQLGKAEAASKVAFNDDVWIHSSVAGSDTTYSYDYYYFSCVHNLLGDPSLEMWTDVPQLFSDINVTRTDNSVTVSGINTDSAIVAYHDIDGSVFKRRATTSSVTFNFVSPNGMILVNKHNFLPYIAPLQLQNVNLSISQYVIASDVVAGRKIDPDRTTGNVTVKSGVRYEIEASGTVTLHDGFKVEKGATFAINPSCF